MPPRRAFASLTCALWLLGGAAATPALAQDASVTVRVESKVSGTLKDRTTVTLPAGAPVVKDGNAAHGCSAQSVAGALERAVPGWTGTWSTSGSSYTIDALLGESHPGFGGSKWAFAIDGVVSSGSICGTTPGNGSALVLYPACTAASVARCFSGGPLGLQVPTSARSGQGFTVRASEPAGSGTAPAAGVFVQAYDGSGTQIGGAGTGNDGVATLSVVASGTVYVKATKGDAVPDHGFVCVTNGADGACGSPAPAPAPPPPPTPTTPPVVEAPCITSGDDGRCGTRDRKTPGTVIRSVVNGRTYKSRGPKTLSGTASDEAGVSRVRLRIVRRVGKACTRLDGKTRKFVKLSRCSVWTTRWSDATGTTSWSLSLRERLRPGRYVLDAEAIDKNGNVDEVLQRGRNRMVFTVK